MTHPDLALHRRALRVWRRLARPARTRAPLVPEARDAAAERLAHPVVGSGAPPRPHGTDWAWRPDAWCRPLPEPDRTAPPSGSRLAGTVAVFHDCARPDLALRQVRNTRDGDDAPFGLCMDVFAFDGGFLSLVVDLPETAIAGLGSDRLVQLDTVIETESPLRIFARLNIRHGPNTARLLRAIPTDEARNTVEFDLAYAGLNDKRITQGWLDLIFESPENARVTLRDVTLCRHPRAVL